MIRTQKRAGALRNGVRQLFPLTGRAELTLQFELMNID